MRSSSLSPASISAQPTAYSKVSSTEDEEEAIAITIASSNTSDLHHKSRKKTVCCLTTGICAAAWAIAVSVIMVTLLVRSGGGGGDSVAVDSPSTPKTEALPAKVPAPTPSPMSVPSPSLSTISALCSTTDQAQLCASVLAAYPTAAGSATLPDLTAYVVHLALEAVNKTYSLGMSLSRNSSRNADMAVLQDCLELLDGARDELVQSLERLRNLGGGDGVGGYRARIRDVRVWLSSAYTDEDTCWDNFGEEGSGSAIAVKMSGQGQAISPLLIVALSFAQKLEESGPSLSYSLPQQAADASAPAPSPGAGF